MNAVAPKVVADEVAASHAFLAPENAVHFSLRCYIQCLMLLSVGILWLVASRLVVWHPRAVTGPTCNHDLSSMQVP